MLEKSQAVKDAEVIILQKTCGVSLTKSKLEAGKKLFIVKIVGNPWNNPDDFIEASHAIGDQPVYHFRPEDLRLA